MNQEYIRKGFRAIIEEAGNDERLVRCINDRLSASESHVPTEALKALFRYFLAIMLPTLLLYLGISMLSIPLNGAVDLDVLADQNTTLVWQSIDVSANIPLILLWFVRGTLRAFILLLAFTFILTAAAMPVRQSQAHKEGGLQCSV